MGVMLGIEEVIFGERHALGGLQQVIQGPKTLMQIRIVREKCRCYTLAQIHTTTQPSALRACTDSFQKRELKKWRLDGAVFLCLCWGTKLSGRE